VSGEDTQERKEEPTPRRRQEARKRGRVLRSPEVTALAVLTVAGAVLRLTVGATGARLAHLAYLAWHQLPGPDPELGPLGRQAALVVGAGLLPLLLAASLTAAGTGLAQTGGMVAPALLAPDLGRLNPLSGLGRMLSRHGLLELGKNLLKVGTAVWLGWSVVAARLPDLAAVARADPLTAAAQVGRWGWSLGSRMLLVLGVLAAVDYAYQRQEHEKSLRMTRRELREELKDTEGPPQARARRQEAARTLRGRRMRTAVAGADVVVANPDHYAVALRYRARIDPAPVVVARGKGRLALLITGVARRVGVPVVHNRWLARALYYGVRVDSPIPGRLYQAVAAVMAYVYQLRGWQA